MQSPMPADRIVHRITLSCVGIALILSATPVAMPQVRDHGSSDARPNIVFVLLDDLDWADVGAYGSTDVSTPTIDSLAEQGVLFTRFDSSGAVCTPARYALLSGQYPSRFGAKKRMLRGSIRGIPADVRLLPDVLRGAGYHTMHVGKWHVGHNRPEFLPTQRGFDQSVRRIEQTRYTAYDLSIDDGDPVEFNGPHLTEALTDFAIEMVRAAPQPFFLNLWYLAPHAPLEVPLDYDNSKTQYDLDSPRGKLAALVTNADRQIARLLAVLPLNTVVIVASDNGGARQTHEDLPGRLLRGVKRDVFEGGIRVPLIVRWPGVVRRGTVNHTLTAGVDILPTLAEIAGAPPPDGDGRSFLGALRGNHSLGRATPLFWESPCGESRFACGGDPFFNVFAVRRGSYKYVHAGGVDYLFNLDLDLGESVNLADRRPNRVHHLRRLYDDWRTVGDIAFAVDPNGNVPFDSRLDFFNGDFSAVARMRPGGVVERVGSWRLSFGERIALDVSDGRNDIHLESNPVAQQSHSVAFAATSWVIDPTGFRLYVDGMLVAERIGGVGPVNTSDEGIHSSGADILRLSTLALYPSELGAPSPQPVQP